VSVNDFIIKAAAVALTRVPQANVSWDMKTQEVQSSI
jgi:pyruvate/2-oxoglutarate dehydrogenase complex dihydrolipoamide acyltransferase (E2) component